MFKILRCALAAGFLVLLFPVSSFSLSLELSNEVTHASFGINGLLSVEDIESHCSIGIERDGWSMVIDGTTLRSTNAQPEVRKVSAHEIRYTYEIEGFRVEVAYQLRPGWKFVGKQIRVLQAPNANFVVHRVVPWDLKVQQNVDSDFAPSTYVPQLGATIEESRKRLPGKDFGEFLRFSQEQGAMMTVQNPFLEVHRDGRSVTVAYAPEMKWREVWGNFESDIACIGAYRLTGRRFPREMVLEWREPPTQSPQDGMDEAEVGAFTLCVREFLIDPSPAPISVEVGWTLNDYQIDVGTEAGREEYKRIIDAASELGIKTLLYAPGNSELAEHAESADSWGWEYVLWLGLGEKVRKGEWDPVKDSIPASVAEMTSYAKGKHIGLLAYVYPSIPYAVNPSWLVKKPDERDGPFTYATLASRELQDYLIRNLIAFQKRTGIAGYSFDYTWLNLPGSSSYTQWYGWRRVMEELRRADPSIVIDGRQSYQTFGPWTWLAGSYPHPTGNDEQPESFKPFPDLHFDRVSADRARFVNYWYRNYQFAPEEAIPGYATHQTERSRNVTEPDGHVKVEMMYTRFRPRDWDYLGYKYSFISSIATAGWNNVVDMIPARDPEEARYFSAEDKAWIRGWLDWATANKEYLRHTRTILDQPALGHVDGTAAILRDHGYLFLFNPNYKRLPAQFSLDETIGLKTGERFLLKEVYPESGRMLGKLGAGAWSRGDSVHIELDGTSATVLELIPEEKSDRPILFNAAALPADVPPTVELKENALSILHAAGEPGTVENLGALIPEAQRVKGVSVNGSAVPFTQSGNYIDVPVRFKGTRFAQAQEIDLSTQADGSLTGTFVVPQRVFDELADRKVKWPIPWTKEDYESTWLVPSRLLLFVQAAEGDDSMKVTGTLDGQPLTLTPAYSSSRVDAACFVGFYADVSKISPDVQHTIQLRMPKTARRRLQGIFFDNVSPQFTESLGR